MGCTRRAIRRSAAIRARARSNRARTSAPVAGGGRIPRPRSAGSTWKRSRMARGFELDRRSFLAAAATALVLPRRLFAAEPRPVDLLEKSDFVYLSPLRKDGSESTCHGEVWFGWLDGTVIVNTRRGAWKGEGVQEGRDPGADSGRRNR